jgi:small subunit ribosomal protein S19
MVEEIRKKIKTFRGKELEFLKGLEIREVSEYLPSRSRRTLLRNFEEIDKFVKSCEAKYKKNSKIRTHLRDMIIVPRLVGMTIEVHNGRAFQHVQIIMEMIGHRLGEFAMTRVRAKHTSAGFGATKGSRSKKK